ncbi:Na+/H+ antiporter subunit E [Coprothermobacteraceae bacterium]|nr:Na+/H+ antiporter subunit E [Coprothermobacteraceae bacterium]
MIGWAWVFITSLALWVGLTGTTAFQEILTGVLVSAVVASIWNRPDIKRFSARGVISFVVKYIPAFLVALVKANLDVAYRVLHPALPINPGFVSFKTELQSEAGRYIMANSITLTPGTITMDVDEDGEYTIHWIDVADKRPEVAKEAICGNFERILKEVTG